MIITRALILQIVLFIPQNILDRLNAHKRDLEALSQAAEDMDDDEDGSAMKEIRDLIEKFENLQNGINEKKEYFNRVSDKWQSFSDQKHKMNAFFNNTKNIVARRRIRTSEDCKKQIEECLVSFLLIFTMNI